MKGVPPLKVYKYSEDPKIPYFTILISILTICYSLYVIKDISGTFFGNIKVIQLEKYGGFTVDHILNGEVWRLLISQLIHVKPFHMLYNVAAFLLMGILLEKQIGTIKFIVIWFLSGSIGTLISTFTVAAPWNLGTGASQAIMGLAALCLMMLFRKENNSKIMIFAFLFATIPAVTLDMITVHYPKLGHITGFGIGLILSYIFMKKNNRDKVIYKEKDSKG